MGQSQCRFQGLSQISHVIFGQNLGRFRGSIFVFQKLMVSAFENCIQSPFTFSCLIKLSKSSPWPTHYKCVLAVFLLLLLHLLLLIIIILLQFEFDCTGWSQGPVWKSLVICPSKGHCQSSQNHILTHLDLFCIFPKEGAQMFINCVPKQQTSKLSIWANQPQLCDPSLATSNSVHVYGIFLCRSISCLVKLMSCNKLHPTMCYSLTMRSVLPQNSAYKSQESWAIHSYKNPMKYTTVLEFLCYSIH